MARSWACTWTCSDTVLMTTSSAYRTGVAARLSSSRPPRTSLTPTSPVLSPASPCPWHHVGRSSNNGYGLPFRTCLLYTSDAADDLLCVDLGGRRIIKKKK